MNRTKLFPNTLQRKMRFQEEGSKPKLKGSRWKDEEEGEGVEVAREMRLPPRIPSAPFKNSFGMPRRGILLPSLYPHNRFPSPKGQQPRPLRITHREPSSKPRREGNRQGVKSTCCHPVIVTLPVALLSPSDFLKSSLCLCPFRNRLLQP